jgi:hypothetical protein
VEILGILDVSASKREALAGIDSSVTSSGEMRHWTSDVLGSGWSQAEGRRREGWMDH